MLLISLCVLLTTGMVCPRHASEVFVAMARCTSIGSFKVPDFCQPDLTWVKWIDLSIEHTMPAAWLTRMHSL